jgi:hypothetical protein
MEHSPSWEAKSHSASQKSPTFHESRRFIIVLKEGATGPYPKTDVSNPHPPTLFPYDPF